MTDLHPDFQSFDEFWPFYVGAHQRWACRLLHYLGALGALTCIALAFTTGPLWWLAVAPALGYGFAWIGHFGYERNMPATFDYPFYSLIAEFKMFALGVQGRMGAEVRRYYGPVSDDDIASSGE